MEKYFGGRTGRQVFQTPNIQRAECSGVCSRLYFFHLDGKELGNFKGTQEKIRISDVGTVQTVGDYAELQNVNFFTNLSNQIAPQEKRIKHEKANS